jgi:TldD protein
VIKGEKAGRRVARELDLLTPAGVGWELYDEKRLKEAIRQLIDDVKEDLALPIKPVEVGRYDTVLDALSVARLLDDTLGRATELDRALGYEANADGTSYLTDPAGMIGTYQAGASLLTVVANRAEPGGAATVRWDDEGIVPDEFPLVQGGVLADFQTTRESAGWLKGRYAKLGKPFRSHGCAAAPTGLFVPLPHPPNLVLTPGHAAHDFDALVAGIANGIAIEGATLDMDFQGSSGLGSGRVYEVKHGKRVAMLNAAGFLFRATELWKNLLALGGLPVSGAMGCRRRKGNRRSSTITVSRRYRRCSRSSRSLTS